MSDDFGKTMGKRLEILDEAEKDIKDARKRIKASKGRDPNKPNGSWKVIVYMAAYGALRSFAERDLFEMCMVNTSPSLQVAVQVHWEEGFEPDPLTAASPIRIAKGQGNNIRFRRTGAAATQTMAQAFEKFLIQESLPVGVDPPGNPQRCMVILWGHSAGEQFGGFGDNGMTLAQIATALDNARAAQRRRLDILGFDSCDMSRVETIQFLGTQAARIVCSQIGVPFSGWPYNTILDRVAANPGMDADDVAKVILDEYYESYRPPRVTMTALDGDLQPQFEGLRKEVFVLRAELSTALAENIADIVADTFVVARRDVADPLLDLRDFCLALKGNVAKASTLSAATKQAVTSAIDVVVGAHDALVKAHERRGPMVSGLNGIGISPYTVTEGWGPQFADIYDRVGWRRPPSI